jgi:hypothetical protein
MQKIQVGLGFGLISGARRFVLGGQGQLNAKVVDAYEASNRAMTDRNS